MKVKLWGVRGSIPTPIRGNAIQEKIRKVLKYASPADILDDTAIEKFIRSLPFSLTNTYGGNTTCVEVRNKKNDLIILDAGTGIRTLGENLMKEGFASGKGDCSMIFTHTHWDHIQGIPFFLPMFIRGNTFHIHSCMDDLEERLRIQHGYKNFPVGFEGLEANKLFYHHDQHQIWELYGMKISHKAMKHPGISYSIRIEEDGKVFILATDAEFKVEDMDEIDEYIEYFSGADILIFDTQYTFEEHLQKIDWGHSSASIATDIALKAGVKKLVLFHHDPSYDDKKLDEVFLRALRYREMMDINRDSSLEILIGYEGLELNL